MTHEAAIATEIAGGDDAFWKFSDALVENQTDFFDRNVADMTRTQIYAKLTQLAKNSAGCDISNILCFPKASDDPNAPPNLNCGTGATQELKFYVKYSRGLGVHVSPSTYLNGLPFDS